MQQQCKALLSLAQELRPDLVLERLAIDAPKGSASMVKNCTSDNVACKVARRLAVADITSSQPVSHFAGAL